VRAISALRATLSVCLAAKAAKAKVAIATPLPLRQGMKQHYLRFATLSTLAKWLKPQVESQTTNALGQSDEIQGCHFALSL